MKEFSEKLAAKLYNEYTTSEVKEHETFEEFVFDKCYSDDDTYFALMDEDDPDFSIGEQVLAFVRFCEEELNVTLI